MRLIAELTMPRNNSWNGKWSHKENKYTILFSTSKNMCKYILIIDTLTEHSHVLGLIIHSD